jgi:excisionase family DNA binding protein
VSAPYRVRRAAGTPRPYWAVLDDTGQRAACPTFELAVAAVRRIAIDDAVKAGDLLLPGQAAYLLQVTTNTLINWAKAGRLGVVREPGRQRLYPRTQVEALRLERAS